MLLFRWIIFFLLLSAGVCFAVFALTGQPSYKRWGLMLVKWTVIAGLGFFTVLILERVL